MNMDNKRPHIAVYIMASRKNGTLYIGVTAHLPRRAYQHRESLIESFTQKYGVHLLVWYELHETMESAIQREKRLKKYTRQQKITLIEQHNTDWNDLYATLF
jgi:putative endonuclease